jgi:hypothetical protein
MKTIKNKSSLSLRGTYNKGKDTVYMSLRDKFRDQFVTPAMVSLNNSIELLALFRKLGERLLAASASGPVKFTSRLRQLMSFGGYILQMRKHHGATTTVKYLKASQLAIQKAVAKNGFKSLRDIEPDLPLPRLTTAGLPRYIPLRDRRLILSGKSPFVLRWWLTLFSVYRVISIPGKLKLGTITDPSTAEVQKLTEVSANLMLLARRFKRVWPKFEVRTPRMLLLETSSSTGKPAWRGWVWDAVSMPTDIYTHFRSYCLALGYQDFLMNLDFLRQLPQFPFWGPIKSRMSNKDCKVWGRATTFGRLVAKDEAAGKIRVFAMVDVWTQSLLRPLHDSIFTILKSLPNDGTFDQEASVKRCFSKAKVANCSFGYDLSAATDRLPLVTQVAILSEMMGRPAAEAWGKLLTGRPYWTPDRDSRFPQGAQPYYYAVGQPMGAYSSWGMLALTHHLIVQLAATQAGVIPLAWFENYELLGDDIVIFDPKVASEYLSIMASLGVPINVSKSVVARNNCFEFAKVTGVNGKNVAAVSWKQFISQNSLMGRVNICYKLWQRIEPASFLKWFKRVTRKSRYSQGDENYSLLALFAMIVKAKGYPIQELMKVIYNPAKLQIVKYKHLLWNVRTSYLERLIATWAKGKTAALNPLTGIWNNEEPWVHLAAYQPIMMFNHKHQDLNLIRDNFCILLLEEMLALSEREGFPSISEDRISYKKYWTTSWDDLWSEEEQVKNSLFLFVYAHITPLIDDHYSRTCESQVTMDSPLESIVELRERIERFQQLLDIVKRATSDTPQRKEGDRVDNPRAKILIQILKSWSRRPAWTVDALKNFKF